MPRNQWCRVIVVKVHQGSNGVTGRADVKTKGGLLQRPVSKLAILVLFDSEADRTTG